MLEERKIFYTWQDIENYLYAKKSVWPKEWVSIDVFSDELIIYSNIVDDELKNNTKTFLNEYMGEYFFEDRRSEEHTSELQSRI